MTKQATAVPAEKPTAELLLRCFKLQDEVVEKTRKENLDAGVDPKDMNQFIEWRDISATTNPKKPGKFYQVSDLRAIGDVPESRLAQLEGKEYPYRKLNSIMKVKTADGKLWIHRHETRYGLTKAGKEYHISVNNLDDWVSPHVDSEYVPKDPKNPDGPSIAVGIIRQPNNVEQPGQFSEARLHICCHFSAAKELEGYALF